jgi:hypothetical protein
MPLAPRSFVPAMSFASVLLACLALTAPIAAQDTGDPPSTEAPPRALVLRIGGESLLASALGPTLREAVFGHTRALGLVPLPTDGGCDDLDCAMGFLATGSADVAAFVEVYGSNGVCQGVQATMVVSETTRFVGTAEVGSAGVEEAMRVALGQAVARFRGEARPTLGVNGTPPGATIRVDGISWGTVPHHEPIGPGSHVIEVRARGFRTDRREITLTGEDLTLEVALVAGEDEEQTPTPVGGSSDTTPLWIASASALVLGITGMIIGFAGLAMGESCDDAACATYSRPDLVASGAWIGAGGALAIAGGVMIGLAATATPTSSAGGGERAMLTLRAPF